MPATHPSPSTAAGPAGGAGTPIRNMRVTFWGVQGSCPIFPTGREVSEYARRIATYTIERAVKDLAEKAARGELTPESLRRLGAPETAAHYQLELGLPDLPVYGGETTCVEVETAEGDILVFDMGSGLREFSSQLLRKWAHRRNRTLHLFGSHEHLDHRSGLPFAGFCFARGEPFTLQLYGTHKFLQTLDERYGVFSQELSPSAHADDPLDYRMMAAKFVGTEIRRRMSPAALAARVSSSSTSNNGDEPPPWSVQDVSESIRIGGTTVTPFEVYHGVTDCLAYKVQHGGATFVFSTDHELRHGEDPSDPRQSKSTSAEAVLIEQCQNADLGYFDGQYFRAEYEGLRGIGLTPPVSRVGWGHGCIEDCIARARKCHVRRSLIGHHDPERQWDERVHLDHELGRMCDGEPCRIELAKQGQVIDL
jgi:ribonuclease BN (tRNA processing enzyme)